MRKQEILETVTEETFETKPKRKRKKKLKKDNLYLQVNGMQYDIGKYVRQIKEENPNICELSVYIKPEDGMIYYVADDIHGKIILEE